MELMYAIIVIFFQNRVLDLLGEISEYTNKKNRS